jgi:glycosyltransferase involved in cell wall biosynthesis
MTSFGVALAHQRRTGKPIVLDVDDEDLMWPLYGGITGAVRQLLLGWLKVDGIYDRLWAHSQRHKASDFLVVSTFLQKRYGGTIIHHGCDTRGFDPQRFEKGKVRREFGFDETQKLILFTGTALPHKGLEEVIAALEHLNIPDLKFVFVGSSPNRSYLDQLLRLGGDLIIPMGHQPHELMPNFLAAADHVVLPQKESRLARAQLPAKLYEAMAMAKPVIATAVGDLPRLLGDGCGMVVPPGDQAALEGALRYVYENPAEADRMGRKARERAKELCSYDAMEKILLDVFRKFE